MRPEPVQGVLKRLQREWISLSSRGLPAGVLMGCIFLIAFMLILYRSFHGTPMTPEEVEADAHIRAAPSKAFCDKVIILPLESSLVQHESLFILAQIVQKLSSVKVHVGLPQSCNKIELGNPCYMNHSNRVSYIYR